jgi:hypothetical protein
MDGGAVISALCKLLPMIIGQEVHNFSQKAVGNYPPLAKIRN